MPGQTDKELKNVSRISKTFLQEYQDKWVDVYRELDDGYRYLAGLQYTEKQRKFYGSFRRPTDTFNIIFPLFNLIMGDMLGALPRMRIYPKPGGTGQIANIQQKLIDHFHIESHFRDQMLRTGLAGCVKVGYMYPRWSNEINIDGSLVSRNVDEFEVLFDSRAEDPLLDDAMYACRSRWLDPDTIIAMWPEHRSELQKFLRDKDDLLMREGVSESYHTMLTHKDFVDEREGQYRVMEWHEFRYETHEIAYDATNGEAEMFYLQGKKRDLYLRANPNVKIIELPNQKVKYKIEVLPGFAYQLSEKKAEVQDRTLDLVPFSAYNYAKRSIDYFGIFRNAKGPQDNFNQWRNQTQHIINQSANISNIFKPDALYNPEDVDNFGSEPGLNIKVKPEYQISDAYQPGQPPKYPFATDKMQEEAAELMQRITGVTPNLLGMDDSAGENASLFANRVKQARTALGIIYHNMRRTDQRVMEIEIKLIQSNLTQEKYFLVTNPLTQQQEEIYVNMQIGNQVLNDLKSGEYQVVPDRADQDPTSRAVRFMLKTELAQFVVQTWGPSALDAEWWLKDADVGDDTTKLIQRIEAVIAAAGSSEEQQGAMAGMEQLLNLAKQKQSLEDAGLPQESGPGGQTAARPNQAKR